LIISNADYSASSFYCHLLWLYRILWASIWDIVDRHVIVAMYNTMKGFFCFARVAVIITFFCSNLITMRLDSCMYFAIVFAAHK